MLAGAPAVLAAIGGVARDPQATLMAFLIAAALAGTKPTTVGRCSMVPGAPPVADITLQRPRAGRVFSVPVSEQDALGRVAKFIRDNNCSVVVEGYADGTPSRANDNASRERAETVRDYLVRQGGAPSDKIRVDAKGTVEAKRIARVVL
jgi:hypothetical protein